MILDIKTGVRHRLKENEAVVQGKKNVFSLSETGMLLEESANNRDSAPKCHKHSVCLVFT